MKGEKQKVYAFLCKTAPEEYNAKTLVRILGVGRESIRRCLSRLVKEKKVIRSDRGFYRAKMTGEARVKALDTEIRAHGIKVEFRPVGEGGSCLLTGPDLAQRGWYDLKVHPVNHSITAHFNFEGRDIILTVFQHYVEVWCHATERPLGFEEFARWCAFLEGTLGDIYSKWDARVTQIGFNMDVPGMRLEGVKSLRLQVARNAWSSAYQKWKDTTRIETHMATMMTPEEAVGILKGAPDPKLDSKLDRLESAMAERFEKQDATQGRMADLMKAMVDEMSGMRDALTADQLKIVELMTKMVESQVMTNKRLTDLTDALTKLLGLAQKEQPPPDGTEKDKKDSADTKDDTGGMYR